MSEEKLTQFVYSYNSGYGHQRAHEYYLARGEEQVWRHVFTFMHLDRVNQYFTKFERLGDRKKHQEMYNHNLFSLEEIKEYLDEAGEARVERWIKPVWKDISEEEECSNNKG